MVDSLEKDIRKLQIDKDTLDACVGEGIFNSLQY